MGPWTRFMVAVEVRYQAALRSATREWVKLIADPQTRALLSWWADHEYAGRPDFNAVLNEWTKMVQDLD
jgi:hypothetical protein